MIAETFHFPHSNGTKFNTIQRFYFTYFYSIWWHFEYGKIQHAANLFSSIAHPVQDLSIDFCNMYFSRPKLKLLECEGIGRPFHNNPNKHNNENPRKSVGKSLVSHGRIVFPTYSSCIDVLLARELFIVKEDCSMRFVCVINECTIYLLCVFLGKFSRYIQGVEISLFKNVHFIK